MIRLLAFTLGLFSCACGVSLKDYDTLLAEVEQRRRAFMSSYERSPNDQAVIDSARAYLFDVITQEIFPAWHGTKWDFNGTTTTPRTGYIACGYFVTTTLEDAGFQLPRVRWAQMASETMILEMTSDVKRYSNKPVAQVESDVLARGPGLYIVGLDNHVGFIVNDSGTVRFVHANYYKPLIGVMSERLDSDNPCRNSRYRIVGKILGDRMIKAWLEGTLLEP
jgi:hypothetical protein